MSTRRNGGGLAPKKERKLHRKTRGILHRLLNKTTKTQRKTVQSKFTRKRYNDFIKQMLKRRQNKSARLARMSIAKTPKKGSRK